jgi:uncharacterized protein
MKAKEYITAELVRRSLANTPQITFEITDRCNLACVYCGYGKLYSNHDKRENKVLEVEKGKRLLDYLTELWNSPLSRSTNNNIYLSFYGGEPLLNFPFIEEIVSFVKNKSSKQRRFTFTMTTNGLLLDKYSDFLVSNDFSILVSLDGDEFANSYRINKSGKSSYKQLVENINRLKTKYPDYFAKRVNFNAVLHNRNSIKDIHDFFKKNYAKIPSIGQLNDLGIRDEIKNEFLEMFQNSLESLMKSENYSELETEMFLSSPTYHSATVYLMQYSEFKFENYNELIYGKPDQKKTIPTGTCLPFSKKIFITVNGKIFPCERIGNQFSLGFIDNENVNINYEEIADMYNRYFSRIDKLCAKCYNSKSCVQCIYNLQDIEKEKCGCNGYMNQERFEAYENSQMNFLARHPEAYSRIMNEVIYR